MDLTTYMIIQTIYWTIAIYYPFRAEQLSKRLLIRLFWLPVLILIVLRWMRGDR